jgi:hypothetical protein
MGDQDDKMQGRELMRRWSDMRYEITRFDESIREASIPDIGDGEMGRENIITIHNFRREKLEFKRRQRA